MTMNTNKSTRNTHATMSADTKHQPRSLQEQCRAVVVRSASNTQQAISVSLEGKLPIVRLRELDEEAEMEMMAEDEEIEMEMTEDEEILMHVSGLPGLYMGMREEMERQRKQSWKELICGCGLFKRKKAMDKGWRSRLLGSSAHMTREECFPQVARFT